MNPSASTGRTPSSVPVRARRPGAATRPRRYRAATAPSSALTRPPHIRERAALVLNGFRKQGGHVPDWRTRARVGGHVIAGTQSQRATGTPRGGTRGERPATRSARGRPRGLCNSLAPNTRQRTRCDLQLAAARWAGVLHALGRLGCAARGAVECGEHRSAVTFAARGVDPMPDVRIAPRAPLFSGAKLAIQTTRCEGEGPEMQARKAKKAFRSTS